MKASDNPFPSLLFAETAAPPAPPAGEQRLFIDPTDHVLKSINSSGTVTAQQGASTINQLSDVDTATTPPTSGQVLEWNGTNWVPATVTSGGGSVNSVTAGDATITVAGTATDPTVALGTVSIDKLSDVDTTTTAPTSGQVLEWNGTAWVPATVSGGGGSGTVTSVTAGNSTITIGGTATDPTVAANVGTGAGSVAAGDDSRIVGAAQKSANLSDLANTSTARTNLGLGTAATANKVAAGSAGVLDATDASTTNARTPTAHASTHASGGSDAVALDASQVTRTTNAQTGTTYTLVLSDAAKFITLTNAAATTLTVPPNSSVAFPVGTEIIMAQLGAGQVTIAAGAGVTVNASPGLKIAAQYGTAALKKTATDTWLAFGRLSA